MTDFDQIDRAEVDATIHAVRAEIGTSNWSSASCRCCGTGVRPAATSST